MNNFITTICLLILFVGTTFSQTLTQTIRGTVLDADSKLPLVGVIVKMTGTEPVIGTSSKLYK